MPQYPLLTVAALAMLALPAPVIAQVWAASFKPARPPVSLARQDPTNSAIHQLHYCTELQMVAWYNAMRGRFSGAQLEQAAAEAVAKCDHLVDAATRRNISVVRQLATNPKLAERANSALAQYSFADWRTDQIDRARHGAVSYVHGIQIAHQPDNPDEAK